MNKITLRKFLENYRLITALCPKTGKTVKTRIPEFAEYLASMDKPDCDYDLMTISARGCLRRYERDASKKVRYLAFKSLVAILDKRRASTSIPDIGTMRSDSAFIQRDLRRMAKNNLIDAEMLHAWAMFTSWVDVMNGKTGRNCEYAEAVQTSNSGSFIPAQVINDAGLHVRDSAACFARKDDHVRFFHAIQHDLPIYCGKIPAQGAPLSIGQMMGGVEYRDQIRLGQDFMIASLDAVADYIHAEFKNVRRF